MENITFQASQRLAFIIVSGNAQRVKPECLPADCSLLISAGNTNCALFILFWLRSCTNRAVNHCPGVTLAPPLTLC